MQQPATQPNKPTEEECKAQRQEQVRRTQALIELLEEWSHGSPEDQEEQRETWEAPERALREDPVVIQSSKAYASTESGP